MTKASDILREVSLFESFFSGFDTPVTYGVDKKLTEESDVVAVVVKSTAMGSALYVKDKSGKVSPAPKGFDKMYPNANTARDAKNKLEKKLGLNDQSESVQFNEANGSHYSISDLLRMDEKVFFNSVRSIPGLQDKPRLMKVVFEGLATLRQMSSNGGRLKPEIRKVLEKVFGFSDVEKAMSTAMQAYNKKIGYDPISMKSEAKGEAPHGALVNFNGQVFKKGFTDQPTWMPTKKVSGLNAVIPSEDEENYDAIEKAYKDGQTQKINRSKPLAPELQKKVDALNLKILTAPMSKKKDLIAKVDALYKQNESKEVSVYIEIDNNGKITRMDPEEFRKSVGGSHSGFAQDWVDKYNKDKGSKMARLVYAKNGKEIGRKVESIKERSSDIKKMKPEDEKKIAMLKASLLNTPLTKKKEVIGQIDSIKAKYESDQFIEGKAEIALAIKEKMNAAKNEYNSFPNEIKRNLTTGEMVYLHYSRNADHALANPDYGMKARIIAMSDSVMVLKINPAIVNNKGSQLIDQYGFLALPKNKKIRGLANIYVYDYLASLSGTDANLGLIFVGSMSSHLIESSAPCPPHVWESGGERCEKCGDKDWMVESDEGPDSLRKVLVHAVTEYDRRMSTKKSYNRYALAQMLAAVDNVLSDYNKTKDVEKALKNNFNDRLLDFLLKKVNSYTESKSLKTETKEFIKGSIFAVTTEDRTKAFLDFINKNPDDPSIKVLASLARDGKLQSEFNDTMDKMIKGQGSLASNTSKKFQSWVRSDLSNASGVIKFDQLEKALKSIGEEKLYEGGPGSGGQYPTQKIKMPLSPFISVGTRKGILKNMPFEVETVPLSKITHVAQRKFVPFKVKRLCKDVDAISKKPICLLKVPSEDAYHVMDGHHRFLAAQKKGLDSLSAKVWIKFEEPKAEEPAPEESPISTEADDAPMELQPAPGSMPESDEPAPPEAEGKPETLPETGIEIPEPAIEPVPAEADPNAAPAEGEDSLAVDPEELTLEAIEITKEKKELNKQWDALHKKQKKLYVALLRIGDKFGNDLLNMTDEDAEKYNQEIKPIYQEMDSLQAKMDDLISKMKNLKSESKIDIMSLDQALESMKLCGQALLEMR